MRTAYRVGAALGGVIVLLVASAAAAAGHMAFWRQELNLLAVRSDAGGDAPHPLTLALAENEWALALGAVLIFAAIAAWGFHEGFDLLHNRPENRTPERLD